MNETASDPGAVRQVAALCYRTKPRVEVLLVTSRETKRWVTPKGWPMKDRPDYAAAATEAFEEAGVDGVIGETPIGTYGYDKTMKSGAIRPVEADLYPLQVIKEREDWPERAERTRGWFTPEEAAAAVQEEDLGDLIRAFGASLAG